MKINDLYDEKNRPVFINCQSVTLSADVIKIIEQRLKQPRDSCSAGLFFAGNTYVELTNLNLAHALDFKNIVKAFHQQLNDFITQSSK